MAQPSPNKEEPSMEDILSSIRKIIQSNDEQQASGSDDAEATSQQTDEAAMIAIEEEATSENLDAAPAVTESQPAADVQQVEAEPVKTNSQLPTSADGDLTSAPARAVERDASNLPAQQPSLRSKVLMSADAESKVASSFTDLTNALDAHSGKNVEELTTELLQPMLTEWLDNNLPMIVERLVREEIERVARGG